MNMNYEINVEKYHNKSKKLDVIIGVIEKVEKINNSKYLFHVYIKDKFNNIYKTMVNSRHTGLLIPNKEITVEGISIKFKDYYKLISYKITYNGNKFSTAF
ncbi:hypothetical protein [Marinitoga aeolica]|uniref:Uncharacterized protein n=1 Tax=Marinitoga aeolica TaxID=2809031 RepID=A0ABY8PQJ3_9BACT|nr:hypothetical protein [Marinitoga aeolica]WGS64892.1 hypothetical protein JRV97_11130 [Marinitoga aeolica]